MVFLVFICVLFDFYLVFIVVLRFFCFLYAFLFFRKGFYVFCLVFGAETAAQTRSPPPTDRKAPQAEEARARGMFAQLRLAQHSAA